jgi:hypothetical protein
MKFTNLMDLNSFFLRCCPYMAGMAEAWLIENVVLVSPAVFQLLTDEEDMDTVYTVARQLMLRNVSQRTLQALIVKNWDMASPHDDKNMVVHFQITKSETSASADTTGTRIS